MSSMGKAATKSQVKDPQENKKCQKGGGGGQEKEGHLGQLGRRRRKDRGNGEVLRAGGKECKIVGLGKDRGKSTKGRWGQYSMSKLQSGGGWSGIGGKFRGLGVIGQVAKLASTVKPDIEQGGDTMGRKGGERHEG